MRQVQTVCFRPRFSRAASPADTPPLEEQVRICAHPEQVLPAAAWSSPWNAATFTGDHPQNAAAIRFDRLGDHRVATSGLRHCATAPIVQNARGVPIYCSMGIETIIERRRTEALWDPELWDFVERVECVDRADLNDRDVLPRPLKHLEDCALQSRLDAIDRNTQYLDIADGPPDDLPPEEGWLSP